MTVQYCTNSTITEAWAIIKGFDAPPDPTEAAVLARLARERFPDLQQEPAILSRVPRQGPNSPSHWNQQFSWAGRKYLARFGHRYLGVHFTGLGRIAYEGFRKTILPQFVAWLGLYSQSLGKESAQHPVEEVIFGYRNDFIFEPKGFDLSRYFKFNVGIEVGQSPDDLMDILSRFRFYDVDRDISLTVQLEAESPSRPEDKIKVTTKIVAHQYQEEPLSFADELQIQALLVNAKDAAKDAFFQFATTQTHRLMGAV